MFFKGKKVLEARDILKTYLEPNDYPARTEYCSFVGLLLPSYI